MSRINRIRENIVSRVISNDNWWEDNILQTDEPSAPLETGTLPAMPGLRSLRSSVRRRRIIEHLLDISHRDFGD